MFVHLLGMLRVGERRLVMLTMLQMESKLAKGDNPSLNDQVRSLIQFSYFLLASRGNSITRSKTA